MKEKIDGLLLADAVVSGSATGSRTARHRADRRKVRKVSMSEAGRVSVVPGAMNRCSRSAAAMNGRVPRGSDLARRARPQPPADSRAARCGRWLQWLCGSGPRHMPLRPRAALPKFRHLQHGDHGPDDADPLVARRRARLGRRDGRGQPLLFFSPSSLPVAMRRSMMSKMGAAGHPVAPGRNDPHPAGRR